MWIFVKRIKGSECMCVETLEGVRGRNGNSGSPHSGTADALDNNARCPCIVCAKMREFRDHCGKPWGQLVAEDFGGSVVEAEKFAIFVVNRHLPEIAAELH